MGGRVATRASCVGTVSSALTVLVVRALTPKIANGYLRHPLRVPPLTQTHMVEYAIKWMRENFWLIALGLICWLMG